MGQINEMLVAIMQLNEHSKAILEISQTLKKLLNNSEKEPEVKQLEFVTLEQVRAVLAEKSRAGHTDAVRGLLIKYGAKKLSEIDPEKYPLLLADAEALEDG